MPYNPDTGMLDGVYDTGEDVLPRNGLLEGQQVQLAFSMDCDWTSEGTYNEVGAADMWPCYWYWHWDGNKPHRVRDVRHQCGVGFPEREMNEGVKHGRITATSKRVCYHCELCLTTMMVTVLPDNGEGGVRL